MSEARPPRAEELRREIADKKAGRAATYAAAFSTTSGDESGSASHNSYQEWLEQWQKDKLAKEVSEEKDFVLGQVAKEIDHIKTLDLDLTQVVTGFDANHELREVNVAGYEAARDELIAAGYRVQVIATEGESPEWTEYVDGVPETRGGGISSSIRIVVSW